MPIIVDYIVEFSTSLLSSICFSTAWKIIQIYKWTAHFKIFQSTCIWHDIHYTELPQKRMFKDKIKMAAHLFLWRIRSILLIVIFIFICIFNVFFLNIQSIFFIGLLLFCNVNAQGFCLFCLMLQTGSLYVILLFYYRNCNNIGL